ncbi:carboxypeptidase-like regulatory domain-containing protein [bacterium]|nr:carboxypeptidase-like regulatory domain-containing protein [bacterium]
MKKLFRTALLSLMVIGISAMCFAGPDTGIFSGTVVDAEYGEAVDGALVFVRICTCPDPEGGLHGDKIYSATTNEFGEFYIENIPVGEWDAIARLRGVGRDEQVILIEAGAETIVTFELADGGCSGGLQMKLQQGGN